jgi:hypothetical protein
MDDIREVSESEESDFSKVVDTLLNDKYKRRKTILNNSQVGKITTIDVLAQIYNIDFFRRWVNNFAEWRTSGDGGKGRQDIVDISKFHYTQMEDDRKSLLKALRGKQ